MNNKNIKYIIEGLNNFNPADYNDNNETLIDSEAISQITDPIDSFILFLKRYNWKHNSIGIFLLGEGDELKEIWKSIINEIHNLIQNHSDEQLDNESEIVWERNYNSGTRVYVRTLCITDINKRNNLFFSYVNDEINGDEIKISKSMFIKDFFKEDVPYNCGTVPVKTIYKIKQAYNLK